MSLEARLERLEAGLRKVSDREAMWTLMSRYARAMDEELDAELGAIYTEDATCQTVPWSKGKVIEGRANIVKLFNGYQRRFINRKRFITNEVVDVTGSRSGTGWSNWLVLHANSGQSYVGWGSYDWGFRRVDDEWLISSMVITVDTMTTLANGWGDAEKLLARFPK
jgi:ketosteroid isomerase-like protein